jgi:hypothetical protein
MTQTAVQKQIDVINSATAKALKSKEAARRFLIDAGIIQVNSSTPSSSKKKKK